MKHIALRVPRFFTSPTKKDKKSKSYSFGSISSSSADETVTTPRSLLSLSAAPVAKKATAVTPRELEVVLRRIVTTEEELASMMAESEADGLVLEEISAAAAAADEGELRETFAVFDSDGDGRISAEELRAVLASLGDELCSVDDCRRMIGGVDTDGDGFVCFDEFTSMMHA